MEHQLREIPFMARAAGRRPAVIAGPCSVESRSQIVDTALRLKSLGRVSVLRAGIWKPRTRPGSFEGIGEKGLPWLMEASRLSGIPAAVEVAMPSHVQAALQAGVDILWIGARTSVNPFAVQQIAQTVAAVNPYATVLVKNPVNPDLELWIGALQRLLLAGVCRLGAIHRGFSAYDSSPYRNAPFWQIPMELHRRLPALPIFHDPSHTGGDTALLRPLSQHALDLGFDGLMIETHPSPQTALSDGGQQITPEGLLRLLDSLVIKTDADLINTGELEMLRRGIDECDNRLLETLASRMRLARSIGSYKDRHNMQVLQPDRYRRLLSALVEQAQELGLDRRFVERLLELIHEESVRIQLGGE